MSCKLSLQVLVLLCWVGCESDPVGDDGRFASSECHRCLDDSCQEELAGCRSDPQCAGFWRCLGACPVGTAGNAEPACESRCAAGSPPQSTSAQRVMTTLSRCRKESRGAACYACGQVPIGPGSVDSLLAQQCTQPPPAVGVTDVKALCWRCDNAHCCESYARYAADAEAVKLLGCIQECGKLTDPSGYATCNTDCRNRHSGGVAAYASRMTCMLYHCAAACGGMPSHCEDCVNRSCARESTACGLDRECWLLQECALDCSRKGHVATSACHQACQRGASSAANTTYQSILICASAACSLECG
jgi:hypothetical protein